MTSILPLPLDYAVTVTMACHRRAASEPAQSCLRQRLVAVAGE